MVRPNTAFTILGLIAAGILWTSVSYAAPFFLGDSLDGGGPGTTGRGSVWFTDFDIGACDYSLTGDVVSDAFLDPDSETAVGIYRKLAGNRQVRRNHRACNGVPACRRVIVHEQDRLPHGRHLNRAGGKRRGNELTRRCISNARAFESVSHPVGLGGHSKTQRA